MDPDPVFQVKRDPDPDPDLDPTQIQGLMTKKLNENPSALKTEHPALQKMKCINFFSTLVGHFCLSSWILIRIADTDPGTPLKSGSNPDPDPQH